MSGVYSVETGISYSSYDEYVRAECNGWSVVSTARTKTKNGWDYHPVVWGPFDTQREAKNAAAVIRRNNKKPEVLDELEWYRGEILSVSVRPIYPMRSKK